MVAEMHGVWASGKSPLLTAEQARYLASKLNRLARRLEEANA